MFITLCVQSARCSDSLHLSFTLLSFNMHVFFMSHLAVLLIGSTVTMTHAGQILDAFNPFYLNCTSIWFQAFTFCPIICVASQYFASIFTFSLLNLREMRLDTKALLVCGSANLFIQMRVRVRSLTSRKVL